MSHYDDKKKLEEVETPLGNVSCTVKKWNEGSSDEHWAFTQELDFGKNLSNETTGHVVTLLLTQFYIAYQLVERGYEFHSMSDDATILWVNYTNDCNEN